MLAICRYAVQRKWMYLESIFIGAEDIRLQVRHHAIATCNIRSTQTCSILDLHLYQQNILRQHKLRCCLLSVMTAHALARCLYCD